jgi:uncharacterized protein (TIGR02147 family)
MIYNMIYEFKDYKKFLIKLIQQMPKKGRGQARKLADHLRVQAVVISQVLSGDREFTAEQGLEVADFFGLDAQATDYLVCLIHHARAGTQNLKQHYEKKIELQQKEAMKLKNKVVEHRDLSDTDKGIFYSNWFYSGIRLLTSIREYETIDAMADRFRMSRAKVGEILEFLVSRGLCVEKNGHYKMGVTATFVDASSKFINNHRRNWRLKGIEKISEPGANDLFYSSPCSLSAKDQQMIRQEIAKLISDFSKRVGDSPAEKLACLNIDWFEI